MAESDLASADALHRAGQELHCAFFLQQAVEKTLKAHVTKQTVSTPPRTHNLIRLSELAGLALKREDREVLEMLTRFYIESRYPEAWGGSPPDISSDKTAELIASTKELVEWLSQQL